MADEKLKVIQQSLGKVAVLRLEGMIDAATSNTLGQALDEALKITPKIVLNFSSVTFISSAGLGRLIAAQKVARKAQGDLILVALSAKVNHIFDAFELPNFFSIRSSQEDAVLELS